MNQILLAEAAVRNASARPRQGMYDEAYSETRKGRGNHNQTESTNGAIREPNRNATKQPTHKRRTKQHEQTSLRHALLPLFRRRQYG